MGLDTTHGCFSGSYVAFGQWRRKLAKIADIPLCLMEGYYGEDNLFYPSLRKIADYFTSIEGKFSTYSNLLKEYGSLLPLKWKILKPDPALYFLLNHSDCEGKIPVKKLMPLAKRLKQLLPLLSDREQCGNLGSYRHVTQIFINGLILANSRGESVEFH